MEVVIDTELCDGLSIPLMFYYGLYEACGKPQTVPKFYKDVISEGFDVKYDTLYRACRKLSAHGFTHFDFENKSDYLYLIAYEDRSFLKIGVSDNPKKRLKQLQTANPKKLVLLCAKKDLSFIESSLHKMFSDLRKNGEWFEYSDDIVKYIQKL